MKKILLFPLSLLLLFICLSCTRDVILKLDPAPPVLVLNASITPEREVAAFLSKSWFLLDSVPEYDLPDEGVKVDVYVNETFRGTMQITWHIKGSSDYRVVMYRLVIKCGLKLRLRDLIR